MKDYTKLTKAQLVKLLAEKDNMIKEEQGKKIELQSDLSSAIRANQDIQTDITVFKDLAEQLFVTDGFEGKTETAILAKLSAKIRVFKYMFLNKLR